MRTGVLAIVCSTLAVSLAAGEPPRLTRAVVSPAPWGVQSGGLVACGVTLDASGTDVTAPPYPSNATGSATVVMEVDVSDQGQVASARVLGAGSAFDAVAVDTIRAWSFRPAVRANRPVASRAFVVFSFVGTTP